MASGEMSAAEFTAFLASSLGLAAANSRDGSIHYVCIDFRHLRELLDAGAEAYAIAPPRARTARRRKNPATDADTATF